jgi:TonB dependent receptor.
MTLSSRWDGSSIWADGNKWDMFPAGAIAWRISDEPVMQKGKAGSNLKRRASDGVTGKAGASEDATLDYSRTGIIGYQDVGVPQNGYSQSIANKSMGWDKSYMTDLGFDLGLFSDRLDVAFDWYRTDTKDILIEKYLPYATGGFGSCPFRIWSKIGETRHTGAELSITSRYLSGTCIPMEHHTGILNRPRRQVMRTTSEGPLQLGEYYQIPGEAIRDLYRIASMPEYGVQPKQKKQPNTVSNPDKLLSCRKWYSRLQAECG